MRNCLYLLFFMGLSSGWVQCHSDEQPESPIRISVVSETLVVTNNYGHPVSYFAVERGTAALIDWGPFSTEDNTIRGGATKTIDWSEIFSDEPLRPGDRIIFYWWPAQYPAGDPDSIRQREVQL